MVQVLNAFDHALVLFWVSPTPKLLHIRHQACVYYVAADAQ